MATTLPSHLFVSECQEDQGGLYDTRLPDWSKVPIRRNYRYTHSRIKTVADFKATLRAGRFAWPGGYPLYLITEDGSALCFDCARKEAHNVIDDMKRNISSGWKVCACEVNYEDGDLICGHCGEQIESAYGDE